MSFFEKPDVKVMKFTIADIITASGLGDGGSGDFTGGGNIVWPVNENGEIDVTG